MKTYRSLTEILAIVEIVDEHADRSLPAVDPQLLLRELQEKLDDVIRRHRDEIDAVVKTVRRSKARKR